MSPHVYPYVGPVLLQMKAPMNNIFHLEYIMKESEYSDLSCFFRNIQAITREMIDIRTMTRDEDGVIVSLLTQIEQILNMVPEYITHGDNTDLTVVTENLESLENSLSSFYSQYQDLQSVIFQRKKVMSEQNSHPALHRIPLFLIHENIYRLTSLIRYYTRLEYFQVSPFFILSDVLEKITKETDGLILISSGCITDPEMVISQIRSRSHIMPVIALIDEKTPATGNYPGFNGIVCEECPLDILVSMFLNGLQEQVSGPVFSSYGDTR